MCARSIEGCASTEGKRRMSAEELIAAEEQEIASHSRWALSLPLGVPAWLGAMPWWPGWEPCPGGLAQLGITAGMPGLSSALW